jgi:adenine phosphoribosyltransferase
MTEKTSPESSLAVAIRTAIRDVPDFPKPGIMFKDITPLLADPTLFRAATDEMARAFEHDGITHIVAIESRGFILGAPVAQRLRASFIPIRKPGKLPFRTHRVDYALEYGTDALEGHLDAFTIGGRAVLVDDVLATGGTASAACQLIETLGGTVVSCAFLLELGFLNGRSKLAGRRIESLVTF